MPEIASEKIMAASYPPQELYDFWCDHADDLDMSVSQYIIRMVEAGRADICVEDGPSDSIHELLQEKATLKREIDRQRTRIEELEQQLEKTSQSELVSVVRDNPGIQTPEIIQHVADSTPVRVVSHLDALEGSVIEREGDQYYPLETADT